MNASEVRTDDRLRSSWDKGLFFVVFAVGSILVLTAKSSAAPGWIAPATGAGAIVLFCGVSWKSPRFRLREDRIGDGAYYLGFLFTLVSLSYSLYQFTEEGGTEGVISGFGVALATTIVGLALRVFFQQLREDPIEIEQEVRQTLSDEVIRLEREVRLSVEALVALKDRTSAEMRDAVGSGLKQILRDSREAMLAQTETFRVAIQAALDGVQESIAATNGQAIETRKSTARLIRSVSVLADKIESTDPPTSALTAHVEDLAATFRLMLTREGERVDKTRESADAILSVYREMESRALEAATLMGQCKDAIEGMQAAMRRSTESAHEMAQRVGEASEDLLRRCEKQIELLQRVEQMSVGSEETLRSLRVSLEAQVQSSVGALTALERNVVQASEVIVRQLSAQ